MVIVTQNKPVNKGFRNILSNRTLTYSITSCISSILDVVRNTLENYLYSLTWHNRQNDHDNSYRHRCNAYMVIDFMYSEIFILYKEMAWWDKNSLRHLETHKKKTNICNLSFWIKVQRMKIDATEETKLHETKLHKIFPILTPLRFS